MPALEAVPACWGAHAKLALSSEAVYKGERAGTSTDAVPAGTPPPGSILVLDIENIKANNLASGNIQLVGLIGETLREAQLNAALIGNADTRSTKRWAALIAMDSRGQIPP